MKFTAGRGWGSACIKPNTPEAPGFGVAGFYSIASFANWEA